MYIYAILDKLTVEMVEIVKNSNKLHGNLFRNIFNPLMLKITKWSDMISESCR